jgi:hypothetical protein
VKLTLGNADARRAALEAVRLAHEGYVVTIEPPNRTPDQNKALHAMLGDVAKQQKWNGESLNVEEWKRLFCAALYRENMLPGLTGGIVIMPKFTRYMSRAEVGELMDFISAWGAEKGVRFSAPAGCGQ